MRRDFPILGGPSPSRPTGPSALYGDAVPAASLVHPLPFTNLALIPGGTGLDTFNVPDPWLQGEAILRDALGRARRGLRPDPWWLPPGWST